MNFEAKAYSEIKAYLENLGYPNSSIFPEYDLRSSKVDVLVKAKDKVLIAIEIKTPKIVKSILSDEIGYHPITRKVQKEAIELGAKYYLLSDGESNLWLKTGVNGRPERIIEISYNHLESDTLSEFEYTNELLSHVTEYIRNFPITGDHLYDVSLLLYSKLIHEIKGPNKLSLQDIVGSHYIHEKSSNSYSQEEVLEEALNRLKDVDLLDNRIAVFEFIDTFFERSRKEWSLPRWVADLMTSFIDKDKYAVIADLFSRNGILTSSTYLKGFKTVESYYTSHKELYWIKIQQILGNQKESEIKFEPGLLSGDFGVLPRNSFDVVLLAPPFNVKFEGYIDTYLGQQGIKDGNSLFIETALDIVDNNGLVIAIVPDGFLLSTQYKKARSYFESKIEAIISLPDETFKPYSSVKTSIIVFRKNKKHKQVFMAFLSEIPNSNPLYKEYDSKVSNLLTEFSLFKKGKEILPSQNGFIAIELNIENFHVSKYWLDKKEKSHDIINQEFSMLPLKELVINISRGSSIVNDNDGNIPCINPATVRELQLNKNHLSFTSQEKIPNGKIHLASQNDILVNIIGQYRGKAALVTKEFENMLVNRHVAIIKPNTNLLIPGYLAVMLNSKFVQEQFQDQTSGTVIPALNLSSFEHIIIPIPSLEIQQQIYEEYAQRLEELTKIGERAAIIEGEITQGLYNLGQTKGKL